MKIIKYRKEWRNDTVLWLIQSHKFDAEGAIKEAKQLEEYIFQNDFIVEVKNKKDKKALKKIIESL